MNDQNKAMTTLTPAALALAISSACSAGIINPGGGAHIWTGAVNTSWNNAGNWTTGSVPADGDAAVVNGSPANIILNADTAQINSLYLAGGRTLSTNGHRLRATQGERRITVNGLDSTLYVQPAPAGAAAVVSHELELQNQSRLQLALGRMRVNDELHMTGDSDIFGRGRLEVFSASPVSLNAGAASAITANLGTLEIVLVGGGAMAAPDELNVNSPSGELIIDAPMFTDVNDVNLQEDTRIEFAQPWTLAGALNCNGADETVTTVAGAPFDVSGAVLVSNGVLEVHADAHFLAGSELTIGTNEEIAFYAEQASDPAAATTVLNNGVMRVAAAQGPQAWSGDILLTGGVLSIDALQDGEWDLEGDLTMDSFNSNRARLEGTAPISLYGDVSVDGLGGEFNTVAYLRTGATIDLAEPQTRLILNDWFLPLSSTTIDGDGAIQINEAGTLRAVEPMIINVDVLNHGAFQNAGGPSGVAYTYINADFEQSATGALDFDIAGPSNMEHDVYEVTGDASFAGELVIDLAEGYVPMQGESFLVCTVHGARSGEFVLAGAPGFVATYDENEVTLTFIGCSADLDGDGAVGSLDLAALLAGWGLPGDTDLNGDGDTDSADLAIVLAAWGVCD